MDRRTASSLGTRSRAIAVVLASLIPIGCGGGESTGEVPPANTIADAAASPDALSPDSAPVDDGATAESGPSEDVGAGFDCTAKPDGTDCGGGSICLRGVCAGSSCGDGFVNAAAGEDCDDANAVSGDGCSMCKFDCKAEGDCSNANVCDGVEKCNSSTHKCEPGSAAADGTTCTLAEGGAGACKGAVCVKAGCGNGVKDAGEDCDDGNADDSDGCTKTCKFTCTTAADCSDGNACNGAETCDVASHKCKAGTPVTCSPKAGCSGTCEPSTGACTYPDADKDGVSCDKDCNDADPAIFPGAFECKDGKDNDCNAATSDSSAPSCLCYGDKDKDGYAVLGAATIAAAGACPDGYTRRAPVLGDATTIDCSEGNASAFPGQTAWFTSSYCSKWAVVSGALTCVAFSYDYNCSGAPEMRYSIVSSTSCPGASNAFACLGRSGWIGSVPVCGAKGTYRGCSWSTSGCTGTETTRTQECR